MARISGVDLPREKRVEIVLTYIFGIGLENLSGDPRGDRRQRHPREGSFRSRSQQRSVSTSSIT